MTWKKVKKNTSLYRDHEKISLEESRLLLPCWYQLYKCQLKVRYGTNPILPQDLPSKMRVFLCFMANENCAIYTSDRAKENNFFLLSRGSFANMMFRRISSSFFLPHLVIIQFYSSAIRILNQREIFLRGLDGNKLRIFSKIFRDKVLCFFSLFQERLDVALHHQKAPSLIHQDVL